MGSKTRKSENSSSPPPDVLKLYQDFLQRAMGNSNLPFQSSIAPFNQDEQSAFGKFNSIPGHYLPQAEAYARQGASPINQQQISRYENPYQQDVINATMGNINETNAQQQNQVVGNAISQGALGGNRVKVAQSELARQQGLANNSTLAGLNASNYQQALQAAQGDRSAAQQGAGQFMGLQDSALQGALAQLNSGRFQQQQASAKLGEKNSFPYQQTNWLGQILGSIGPLEGGTSTQTQPGPSIFSQLLGLGTAGVGAFGGKGMTGGKGLSPTASNGIGGGVGGGGLWARGGAVEDHARSTLGLAGALRSHFAGGGIADPYEGGISIPPYTPAVPDIFGSDYASDFNPSRLSHNGTDLGALLKHYIATKQAPQGPDMIAGPPEAVPSTGEEGLAYGDTGNAGTPLTGLAAANSEAQPSSLAALAPPQKVGWRLPIMAAGLGMMASQSPFIGTAIGEGGLAGIQAYSEAKKAATIQALAQSELGLRGRSVDLEAERLQQQADQFAKNLALETEKMSLYGPQAQSVLGKLANDRKHGLISQDEYDSQVAATSNSAGSDADTIATAIANGDQPPVTTGLYKLSGPVRAALEKKGFNLTRANQDWTSTNRLLNTMNGAQQTRLRQAVGQVKESLQLVESLADAWNSGGFPALNKIQLEAAKQGALGPQAQSLATQLEAEIADITSELGTVYKGGNSSTDESLKLAATQLSANWSEKTLRDAIALVRQNIAYRENSLKLGTAGIENSQYNQIQPTPTIEPSPLPPAAPSVGGLEVIGETEKSKYDALPSGAHYIGPDGKERIKP